MSVDDSLQPGAAAHARAGGKTLSGAVALAALGVVFGDIGTSPLYTLKTCFTTAHVAATPQNVIGIVSALLWTLIAVVSIKYVTFVMKVDYRGEGGIFALLARLLPPASKGVFAPMSFLTIVAIVGGAALFGDGIITPAISVLSAVEGMSVLTPAATTWEVPVTIAILIVLFVIQSRGTEKVGIVFGPVMALWFAAIGVAGAVAVVAHPRIIAAFDPAHAVGFITKHGLFGFLVLGATILCVTGAEALYADMSHFGRRPITLGWYAVVFPALVLNYLGQGGQVLSDPKALDNAFYALTPGWMLIPTIVLATLATVIASQALISGAFTLVEQAIGLNLVPRMRVVHTSNRYPGQVFVPAINVLLGIGCIALVLTFRTSDALASAYGLAVSLTMLATTVLFYAVVRRVLGWNPAAASLLCLAFLILDVSFVLAGLAKIPAGGWIPLAIAAVLTFMATTWYEGRRRLAQSLASAAVPVEQFIAEVKAAKPATLAGTAVFLTGNPTDIPYILRHQWVRLQSLNERVVLLTIEPAAEPDIDPKDRVIVEHLSGDNRLVRVQARFGFMELPTLEPITRACSTFGLDIGGASTSFVVASPQIVPKKRTKSRPMLAPRRWLFDIMQRLAGTHPTSLGIPPDQLVELGVEVAL